ncbi:MAG: D-alanyl-D-alanine carboxypeptidase [Oscillospiraceae bacterium]|nr:D-alanyl-D-alanine carboxypeptidase [Oscillospiraceae bacterium]
MEITKKIAIIFLTFQLVFLFSSRITTSASDISIKAPSAVLMESSTGKILFEKNSHEKRACGALTKIMSLLLISEAIDNNKISMDDTITVGDCVSSVTGAHVWLRPGEQITVKDLVKSIAIASANDATLAIAHSLAGSEENFVSQMQKKAEEIGMKDTVFKNCNGIEQEGHLSSANDIAIVSQNLLKHPEICDLTSIWMDTIREGKTQIVNSNVLVKNKEYGITGIKSGTTKEAGSCVSATANRDNLSLVCVVLGGQTGKDRFEDALKVFDFGFNNYKTIDAEPPSEGFPLVKVIGGMKSTVEVEMDPNQNIVVEAGQTKQIVSEVVLPESLEAPVEIGQKVGEITYQESNHKDLAKFPIFISEKIEKLSFGSSLSSLFESLIKM